MDEGIDEDRARQAIAAGLRGYPEFAAFEPRLVRVKLFRGSALKVEYGKPEGRPEGAGSWAFQDAVIGEYKRLSGETHAH